MGIKSLGGMSKKIENKIAQNVSGIKNRFNVFYALLAVRASPLLEVQKLITRKWKINAKNLVAN